MSKPFPKSPDTADQSEDAPVSSQLIVTLSPLRRTSDSPAPITINASSRTSIYDLKTHLGARSGYAPDKLKILWQRKPVTDSKTLKEVVGQDVGDVDMAVMYSGPPTEHIAVAQSADKEAADAIHRMDVDETPITQSESGEAVLNTDRFWTDLQDFVVDRVKNESVGKDAVALWKQAWKSK